MGGFYDSEAFAGTRDERSLAEYALEDLLDAKSMLKGMTGLTVAQIFGAHQIPYIRRSRLEEVQVCITHARSNLEAFCKQKNIDVTLGVADINEMSEISSIKKQVDNAIEKVKGLIEKYKS